MTLKERAGRLKHDIPAVYLSLKDRDTPVLAKVLAGVTLCYALSPIDLIPDFIPLLGFLDDVILLPALIALTIRLIPREVWAKNRGLAQDLWESGAPKRWYFALPIVALWLLAALMIARAIWS